MGRLTKIFSLQFVVVASLLVSLSNADLIEVLSKLVSIANKILNGDSEEETKQKS